MPSRRGATRPNAPLIVPDTLPAETTKVVVWRPSENFGLDLDEFVRRWAYRGWSVRRCEPRVLEGPTYGALLVLERELPKKRLQRRPSPNRPTDRERRSRTDTRA